MAEMRMELDEANAVLAGVCAGFARWADVDPFLVRVTAVLITLFFAPVAIPAYVAVAARLKPEPAAQGSTPRPGLWRAPFAASQIGW